MRGVRRTLLTVVAVAAMASTLVAVSATPAAAADGTLQGTVTSSSLHTPLAGIQVRAHHAVFGTVAGTTTTNGSGGYSFTLPAGNYRLRFDSPTDAYERIYSGGSPTWLGSSTVAVPSAGVLTYDIAMHAVTGITGTITDTGAAPIQGAQVIALHPVYGYELTSATTAADGTYELPMEPTTIRIRVTDPTDTFADVYSGGVGTWAASSTFAVTSPGPDTFDATMATNPVIEGTVTADGGGPLAGITVNALDSGGWPVGTATTAADGTYSLTADAGTLKVQFADPTHTYATQYSGGSDTRAGATPVNAVGGGTYTVDIALPLAAHLTGTATIGGFGPGIANVYVGIVDGTNLELLAITATAPDGTWDSGAIPPGDHKIVYVDPSTADATPTDGYRLQFAPNVDIDSQGLGPAYAAATTYPVTAGATAGTGTHPLVGYHCNPTTHFPGADLSGTYASPPVPPGRPNLKGCDLDGANLHGAWLPAAWLDWADLSGADLGLTKMQVLLGEFGYPILTFSATMTGTRITGADLHSAVVSPQQLLTTNPDWTGADLRANFPIVNPPYAYPVFFAGTAGIELLGAATPLTPGASIPFSGSPLVFEGSILDQALVDGLAGLTISGWTCTGCRFGGTDALFGFIGGADLSGTDISGANLAGANLLDANLTDAVLTGVTGNPAGGSTATYSNTTCPNGEVTNGTTILDCVSRGLSA